MYIVEPTKYSPLSVTSHMERPSRKASNRQKPDSNMYIALPITKRKQASMKTSKSCAKTGRKQTLPTVKMRPATRSIASTM